MLNIAVVSADEMYIDAFIKYVSLYNQEKKSIFLDRFSEGESLIENYNYNYDILFMDVKLPGINGIQVSQIIRKKDAGVSIVLTDDTEQYAICGYEIKASAYYVKPLLYVDFCNVISEAIKKKEDHTNFFLVKGKDNICKINFNEIIYIESRKHKVIIYTKKEIYEMRTSMKAIDQICENHGFAHCHASFLVNLSYVGKIEKDRVVLNFKDFWVPMSRQKKAEFINKIHRFTDKIDTNIQMFMQ